MVGSAHPRRTHLCALAKLKSQFTKACPAGLDSHILVRRSDCLFNDENCAFLVRFFRYTEFWRIRPIFAYCCNSVDLGEGTRSFCFPVALLWRSSFFSKYVINRESFEKLCFRIKGLREADCGYWAALLACGLLFFECVFSFHLNILFLSVGTSKK